MEKLLFEKQLNLQQNEKKTKKKTAEQKKNPYYWVKYVLYIWAIRLGFSGFGLIFPTFFAGFPNLLNPNFWTSTSTSESKTETFRIIPWNEESLLKKPIQELVTKTPYVIQGIPLAHEDAMYQVLAKSIRSLTSVAKVSNLSEFEYLSNDRLWSKLLNVSKSYKVDKLSAIKEFRKDGEENQEDVLYKHWYISQPIPNSIQSSWLRGVSPSYSKFTSYINNMQSTDSNVLIWMASPNTTVRYHYDMEDNFFFQLTGSKTFLLMPPSSFKLLNPHSSFHPQWRQSQNAHEQSIRLGVQKVTLKAGDMLYIPAYHFHRVIAGSYDNDLSNDIQNIDSNTCTTNQYSGSVNSWVTSMYSDMYKRMLRNVPLPYSEDDAIESKLANLGKVTHEIFQYYGNTEIGNAIEIANYMKNRYMFDTSANVERDETRLMCSEIYTVIAGSSDSVRTSVHEIISVFSSYDHMFKNKQIDVNEISIRLILFMDYVEEILSFLLDNQLSPSTAVKFMNECALQ